MLEQINHKYFSIYILYILNIKEIEKIIKMGLKFNQNWTRQDEQIDLSLI